MKRSLSLILLILLAVSAFAKSKRPILNRELSAMLNPLPKRFQEMLVEIPDHFFEPEALALFRHAYKDLVFSASFDEEKNDWKISITAPKTTKIDSELRTETFWWCGGGFLPEEELLKGLLLDSGSINTLGQRPGGSGISYRVDGKEVFSSGTGTVTGEMTRDTSGTYFVYGIPIRKGDSATMEYHIMNGADEIRCVSPTENGTIYDIKVRDGTVYRSEKRGASASSLCLVVGDTYHSVNAGADESVHLCKLTETGGEMTIKGYSVQGNRKWHWIRSREGVMCRVDTPGVQDFYVDGSAVAFVVNGKDGFVGSIHAGGAQYGIEEKRYRLSSSACADFRGGVFAAALSDTSGREHRLFLDGQLVPMEFNGYFTELKIIE